jgi:hypothetical protein
VIPVIPKNTKNGDSEATDATKLKGAMSNKSFH